MIEYMVGRQMIVERQDHHAQSLALSSILMMIIDGDDDNCFVCLIPTVYLVPVVVCAMDVTTWIINEIRQGIDSDDEWDDGDGDDDDDND